MSRETPRHEIARRAPHASASEVRDAAPSQAARPSRPSATIRSRRTGPSGDGAGSRRRRGREAGIWSRRRRGCDVDIPRRRGRDADIRSRPARRRYRGPPASRALSDRGDAAATPPKRRRRGRDAARPRGRPPSDNRAAKNRGTRAGQLVQQYAKDLNGDTVSPKVAQGEANAVFRANPVSASLSGLWPRLIGAAAAPGIHESGQDTGRGDAAAAALSRHAGDETGREETGRGRRDGTRREPGRDAGVLLKRIPKFGFLLGYSYLVGEGDPGFGAATCASICSALGGNQTSRCIPFARSVERACS